MPLKYALEYYIPLLLFWYNTGTHTEKLFSTCNKTLDLVIMSFINKFLSLVLYMSCGQ
jgi:hypothetical protein